jgi:hypothetical protein
VASAGAAAIVGAAIAGAAGASAVEDGLAVEGGSTRGAGGAGSVTTCEPYLEPQTLVLDLELRQVVLAHEVEYLFDLF